MRIEMLDGRFYREQALEVGQVIEVDGATAQEWLAKGYARPYAPAQVLTAEEADAVVPVKLQKRRRSVL